MSGLHGTLLLEMVVIELRVSPKSSPNLSPWSSPESSPLVQSSPESRFYTYPQILDQRRLARVMIRHVHVTKISIPRSCIN